MPARSGPATNALSVHAGWIAGGLVVLGVLLFGAFVWFTYHP
ncbi:MAG TPA: hypothetical protein VEH10_02630 [Thermoplasmata archaeon]|nr:hypothetical protein [Thermoplasmata archaeon]